VAMMLTDRLRVRSANGRREQWEVHLGRSVAVLFASVIAATPVAGCADSNRAPVVSGAPAPRPSASVAVPISERGNEVVARTDSTAMPLATESTPAAPPEALSVGVPTDTGQTARACSAEDAAKWIANRNRYSPSKNDLATIVQSDEYEPIDAIRTLYVQVSGTTKFGEVGIEGHLEVEGAPSGIRIAGKRRAADVELSDTQVKIGQRFFREPKTVSLFRTLAHVLADLSSECIHQGVRGIHLRTRAYRDNLRLEFGYGQVVVSLESLSNGPVSPYRLYVLDIIEPKDSLMWAREEPANGSAP
jgi:hypothetical protein